MTTGEKIAALRKQAGFSQEQFAEKLGISRQAVSKWENGTATPTSENLARIGRLFGVQVSSLLDEGDIEFSGEETVPVQDFTVEKTKNNVTNVFQSAAIIVLAIAVMVQGVTIGRLKNEISSLITQTADVNRLQREIESLRGYVYSLPSTYTQSSKDFTDYHYRVTAYNPDTNIATLKFSVVPTGYTRDTQAKIVIKGSTSTCSAEAVLENDIFTASVDIWAEDNLPVYLYLTDGGRTRSFLLDYLPDPADGYRIKLYDGSAEGSMKVNDGLLEIKTEYNVAVDYTVNREKEKSVYPVKAVLQIYADENVVREIPYENMMDFDYLGQGEIELSATTAQSETNYVEFGGWIDEKIKDDRISKDSDISIVLLVHDNHGREYRLYTDQFAYVVK